MYTLGIDLSSQSITLCLLDYKLAKIVDSYSLAYKELIDSTTTLDKETLLMPSSLGLAEQDPQVFLKTLSLALANFSKEVDLAKVEAIQISAQQHGHVYLNTNFATALAELKQSSPLELSHILKNSYAYAGSPIWRTSNTSAEAQSLTKAIGGEHAMIEMTGSLSPLRFTGAIIKKMVSENPTAYGQTVTIKLLNTWLASILTATSKVALDYGNASGTSLMDYNNKTWCKKLVDSIDSELHNKLDELSSPLSSAGTIAPYFVSKYGFRADCQVGIGTGDNPASKVVFAGNILSLGTSFVYMQSIEPSMRDKNGMANAMYDGLGEPFMISCRTNGAMVWDRLRLDYKADFKEAHQALEQMQTEFPLGLWQLENESLPPSPAIPLTRDNYEASFASDYKALILSSLGLLSIFSDELGQCHNLAITGGASSEPYIVSTVANLWQSRVSALPSGGSALGAAMMATKLIDSSFDIDKLREALLGKKVIDSDSSSLALYQNYKKNLKNYLQDLFS